MVWQFAAASQRHSGFPDGELALAVEFGASGAAGGSGNEQFKKRLRKIVHGDTGEQWPSVEIDPAWLGVGECTGT